MATADVAASLPEIPKHFWLGKGSGFQAENLELAIELNKRGA